MNKKNKDLISKIILIISLTVFVISFINVYIGVKVYYKNNKLYSTMENLSPFTNNNNDLSIAYSKLKDLNDDYVGWLYIPGTNISYPMVKGTDNSFYLNHNFLKDESKAGSIFVDYNTNAFEDRNTIIYGHYMKDGSMFAGLHSLLKGEINNSSKVYVALQDTILEYEIFSIYSEEANINSYETTWIDDTSYIEYLNMLKGKSIYKTDILFNSTDRIITLSTCTFNRDNGRLLIHAKLLS